MGSTSECNKWRIILVFIVSGLLFFSGCQSGYKSGGGWGCGYGHEKIRHNVYAIHYIGNLFTEFETVSDYAQLRAADIAMEKGYNYFKSIDVVKHRQNKMLFALYGPTSASLPFSGIIVFFFREEPKHLDEYFEAEKTFNELVTKHEIMRNEQYLTPNKGTFTLELDEIEFTMRPAFEVEPIMENEVRVIFGVRDFHYEGINIGRYTDIENPMMSLVNFAEYVRPIAAEHGANAVLIEDKWQEIHSNSFHFGEISSEYIGFIADLYILPPVSLGVYWEPGDLANGKHVIRKFYTYSKGPESGLKIGDRVIEINDVDMLDERGQMELFSQWNAGDIATVDVVRDGQEISIEVPLISNL